MKISKKLLFTLLSLSILCPIYSSTVPINIKGLKAHKEIQSYLDTLVVSNYSDSKDVDIYSLREDTLKALKAKGYYAAEVNVDTTHKEHILTVELGSIYRISEIKIVGYEYLESLNIQVGDVLDAEKVLTAQKDILHNIKAVNCYYALSAQHEIILDHNKQLAALTYQITTGPQAKFGQTTFTDLKTVKPSYIQSLELYHQDECWNLDKVEETKTAFMNTGLFSYVKTELPENPDQDGIVNFSYTFVEKPPRSVRVGVNHQTDQGLGFQAKWTHRNLFGSAEELSHELKVSDLIQSLKTDYSSPHFFGFNRSLSTGVLAERKNTDAFEELNLNVNAYFKNKHTNIISTSMGITAGISEVRDESDEDYRQTFGLVSLPGMVIIDSRDNPLDPHNGILSQAQLEPFVDILGHSSPFLRLNFSNNFYVALAQDSTPDPVLAVRTNVGTILGDNTVEIPASKRFFAGGSNSIRGFEFQRAGPLKNGDPTGGRSLIELSSELRVKITKTMGVVGFVDAGNVYHETVPDFSEGFSVGVGAGFRYYTDFGPIRFDIATPVNNLENNRKRIQFYISLGQAF